MVGAANNSVRRVAFVPTGVGSTYAPATNSADNNAPQRTTARRQHNPATARQISSPLSACSSAKGWRPPLPNASPTSTVGTRALIASVRPPRRRSERKSAPPATPRNRPATELFSAARTDNADVTRRRPERSANSAPSPSARPRANVVRVVTRFPVRQTAPTIAPATGRGTAVRFNKAAKRTTLAT
jgi:hypothetical protein